MSAFASFLADVRGPAFAHLPADPFEVSLNVGHDRLGLVPFYLAAEILAFPQDADDAGLDQADVVFGEAFAASLQRQFAVEANHHGVRDQAEHVVGCLWWQHEGFLSLMWRLLRDGAPPRLFLAVYGAPTSCVSHATGPEAAK